MRMTRDQRLQRTEDREQMTDNRAWKRFRFFLSSVFCLLFSVLCLLSSGIAFASQTIVAHETDRYFYKDGKVLRYEGQYENTYFLDLDKDTLTRTRIYDFLNKKITPDETVYHIEKQLLSHPTNSERYILPPVIRAVGQTNADTIEMLVIEDGFVNAAASSTNELVISRAKRLK